ARLDEHDLERMAMVERVTDEVRAFEHKSPFVPSVAAPMGQAPQPLNPRVASRKPRRRGQALTLATRPANAAGSVTARSARILRSTSMPASRSPAMNRL